MRARIVPFSVSDVTQPDFIRALLDPGAHPREDGTTRVELRETHISWLLVCDRFVYKIKKPVDLGFLDFSTLELRRFYCFEEARLNRRLSPDVYLGVSEIRRGPGGFALSGAGEVVDYAVRMRRLPADGWLSAAVTRGEVTEETVRRIAARVADFHGRAEMGDHISRGGSLDVVRANVEENFQQTAPFLGGTLTHEIFDVVRAYSRAFLDVRSEWFRGREARGRVRDCHGDLHLAQICIENGISFIDCIEFNERFRFSDVAADVAFTAMDLERHGRPDLSRAFLDEYVVRSGDDDLSGGLDLYRCYRAFTRGKIESFRLRQLEEAAAEVDEREQAALRAGSYFDLAREYASLPGPLLILVTGLMGSGKSTVAEQLASRLRARVIRSDVLRKELAGIRPEARQFEDWNRGIYAPDHTRRTYDGMFEQAGAALSGGEIVILDASFSEALWRDRARALATEAQAGFLAIEVTCDDVLLRERLIARHTGGPHTGEPHDGAASVSDGRIELLEDQRRRFEALDEVPEDERIVVDASGPPPETAYRALEEVYRRRLRRPIQRPAA